MGSCLTRMLLMCVGYVYPAYNCYKTIEKHELDMEQLKFWCQYWILMASLAVCEIIGDNLMSWLPLYDEAKLALVLSLWHPKTRAAVHLYGSVLQPYLARHEAEVDMKLEKLKSKAAVIASVVWQTALSYGHYTFLEAMQRISSQTTFLFDSKIKNPSGED